MTDKVISVGDDYRQWPRELWGTRDKQQAAKQDWELQAAIDAGRTSAITPLVVPIYPGVPSALRLYEEPHPPREPRRRDPDGSLFKALEPDR